MFGPCAAQKSIVLVCKFNLLFRVLEQTDDFEHVPLPFVERRLVYFIRFQIFVRLEVDSLSAFDGRGNFLHQFLFLDGGGIIVGHFSEIAAIDILEEKILDLGIGFLSSNWLFFSDG